MIWCFVCGKQLKDERSGMWRTVETSDGQTVFVGPDCYAAIKAAGSGGYQPSAGGPRLFVYPQAAQQ